MLAHGGRRRHGRDRRPIVPSHVHHSFSKTNNPATSCTAVKPCFAGGAACPAASASGHTAAVATWPTRRRARPPSCSCLTWGGGCRLPLRPLLALPLQLLSCRAIGHHLGFLQLVFVHSAAAAQALPGAAAHRMSTRTCAPPSLALSAQRLHHDGALYDAAWQLRPPHQLRFSARSLLPAGSGAGIPGVKSCQTRAGISRQAPEHLLIQKIATCCNKAASSAPDTSADELRALHETRLPSNPLLIDEASAFSLFHPSPAIARQSASSPFGSQTPCAARERARFGSQ